MTAVKSTEKPDKPYPEYPLFAARNGQWAKKFRGKRYYFGPWTDPNGALDRWLEFRDQRVAGRETSTDQDAITVADLVEAFMDSKDAKVQSGDLAQRTFNDYHRVGKWVVASLGEHRPVDTLQPTDFTKLRAAMPSDWGTVTIQNQIVLTRTIFKWAYESALIEKPVRYGDNFSKPSKKRQRLERATKPEKQFTAKEIHRIADKSATQMRAMILLGINCGYGNIDCARLRVDDIKGVWLTIPRGKTGEARKAWLWPETREAIAAVMAERAKSKVKVKPGCEDLVFRTHHGREWVSESDNRNAVSIEFAKVKKLAKCHRVGVSFYSLRHTFETIAGETKDQVAVDHCMGHVDDTMAAVYREGVSDARVKAVCEHVRQWYATGKPKKKAAKKRTKRTAAKGGVA